MFLSLFGSGAAGNETPYSLTMTDGVSPVSNVNKIVLEGLTLTDDGGGQVTVAPAIVQPYEQDVLAADNSVATIEDVGVSITKTLEDGVLYRWKFDFCGVKTTTGNIVVVITDESNNIKQTRFWSISNGFGVSGFVEFIEEGTGAEVTRKVRAYCNSGSFNFDVATGQVIIFSVEKCG
jgi:hypothetical protein